MFTCVAVGLTVKRTVPVATSNKVEVGAVVVPTESWVAVEVAIEEVAATVRNLKNPCVLDADELHVEVVPVTLPKKVVEASVEVPAAVRFTANIWVEETDELHVDVVPVTLPWKVEDWKVLTPPV